MDENPLDIARFGDCTGRVMECLRHYRSRRRPSYRAIERLTGVCHTHVGTIIKQLLKRGVLKLNAKGYEVQRVPSEEVAFHGMRWLPIVWCGFTKPIDWSVMDDENATGDWLPKILLAIPPRVPCGIAMFHENEPDAVGFPPFLGVDCVAIVRPLREPADARVDQWCLVTHQGRARSMYRVEGEKFIQHQGLTKRPVEIPVSEVEHVAVIDTLMQTRTRGLNRLHRQMGDTVNLVSSSADFQNLQRDDPVISVRLDALRKRWRVPHQLTLSGIADSTAVVAQLQKTGEHRKT